MVFKCSKGMYQLQKNYRDAFNLEAFQEKYLEECFDRDMYIVGDISSTILRLKGFDTDPKSKNYFGFIDDYLDISCAFGCPYYVLKRIRSEEEYAKLEKENKAPITDDDRVRIRTITKENFDKESLVLKTSPKGRPNIVIDARKINAIPKGELPQDLKGVSDVKENSSKKSEAQPKPEPVTTQTYVSSSADFDPSKKEQRRKPDKKQKNNNNSQNQNKNKGGGNNNSNPQPQKPQQNNPNANGGNNPAGHGGNNNSNNHNNHKNKNFNRNKGNGNKPKPEGQ